MGQRSRCAYRAIFPSTPDNRFSMNNTYKQCDLSKIGGRHN